MKKVFSDEQLIHIRNQALIYQCACPAQVCVAIDGIRKLHDYQLACLEATNVDCAVHNRIKDSAEHNHAELERCLTDILRIEGWDMDKLTMPPDMKKRLLDEI